MSTGGAAINATMKQIVAASNVGIIRVPNQPTYRRLFVEVTQEQKSFHRLVLERVAIVAVILLRVLDKSSGGRTVSIIPHTTLQCGYERRTLYSP